ncbi:hypothetical protein [Lysinibacillus xylanilyticus]|uniref:hypothetical protein n=1 Tax=Lysinibacillus xylanilyticus TaxID=582475 RepID=UPI003CFD8672
MIQEQQKEEITLFWDIDDIIRETRYKKTFLEAHLLCDPRIKRYERKPKPRSKRVWLAEPTKETIKKIIMNEWS